MAVEPGARPDRDGVRVVAGSPVRRSPMPRFHALRRALLTSTMVASWWSAGTASVPARAQTEGGSRMVIESVDRFRVREPNFEGVRIVLDALGDRYSPAYIQGISGAAFRFGGPCPCAPNCSTQMDTTDLIKLLGYEYTQEILGWTGDVQDAKENIVPLIPKIKDSIRAGRPVLLWYGFADSAYEVVTGFDDAEGVFLGYHMHQGADEGLAKAKQDRAQECAAMFPALGAIFIGEQVGALDARAAEAAALKEAVRHAHDREVVPMAGRPDMNGLLAYDRWAGKFRDPEAKRWAGDSHCYYVYRSTHRAAGQFLGEIAPHYPRAAELLTSAAREFTAEADVLDEAEPLLAWQSPEHDAARNARLWPLLTKARDHYAAAIALIEKALPLLG